MSKHLYRCNADIVLNIGNETVKKNQDFTVLKVSNKSMLDEQGLQTHY